MATSTGNNTSDLLICPICLEKLKNPKYLPCLHTFCEGCIQTYITSGFEKGNIENINCPICRSVLSVPHENCSAENWAKRLPVNFLIVGLLEKEKVQREEKKCMLCERLGTESDAIVLCINCSDTMCDNCRKCHTVNKFTCDHDIRPLSEISDGKFSPKAFINKCVEHKREELKLFCADHDVSCCPMCVSMSHRKCEKVIYIEDAASAFRSDENVDRIELEMSGYEEDMKTITSHNKNCLSDLDNQYKVKLEQIEGVCKVLISTVEEFEIKKKSELQKLYDQKKDHIETHNVIIENNLKAISNERDILKVSKNEAPDVQVMLEVMKIRKLAADHKKLLTAKAKECNFNYELTLDNIDDVEKLKLSLDALCKIDVRKNRVDLKLISVVTETVHMFNRFNQLSGSGWWTPKSSIDAIYFTVSREISLLGILSYANTDESACNVLVTLTEDNTVLSETTCFLDNKNAKDNLIEVKLINPVNLKPNIKYRINFKNKESYTNSFNYGTSGQPTVECEGVVFRFENDPECCNGRTSVNRGQIPGFIFSC